VVWLPFGHRWPVGGQSVGEGSGPKGSRCARAPVAIRPLHAKTPPRPFAAALESLGVGACFLATPSEGLYRPVGGGGVGGQSRHLAKSVLGSLRWPVGAGAP